MNAENDSLGHPHGARKWLVSLVVAIALLASICMWILIPQWVSAQQAINQIPFNLHSSNEADYSKDESLFLNNGVDLTILRDFLMDHEPESANIDSRVQAVLTELKKPVPGNLPIMAFPIEQTPSPEITQTPEVTQTLIPTSSLSPTKTPTPQATFTRTSTPIATATFTGYPTAPPTATLSYTPSSTHTPAHTSTPTPLNTSTPVSTNTFTSTPVTSGCSDPSPVYGFISSVNPSDGETNFAVTTNIVIQFNQSMDLSSLIYGDERNMIICKNDSNNCPSNDLILVNVTVENNSYTNDRVILNPINELDEEHTYYLTIGNQISNACGTNQGLRYSTTFTTDD